MLEETVFIINSIFISRKLGKPKFKAWNRRSWLGTTNVCWTTSEFLFSLWSAQWIKPSILDELVACEKVFSFDDMYKNKLAIQYIHELCVTTYETFFSQIDIIGMNRMFLNFLRSHCMLKLLLHIFKIINLFYLTFQMAIYAINYQAE